MKKVLFILLILPCTMLAQVLPKENSVLNYRLIGFLFPKDDSVVRYDLDIAAGNIILSDSFSAHLLKRVSGESNRIISDVPSFGSSYTWRITYEFPNNKTVTGPLYHFSTDMIPEVDTNITRLRVIDHAQKYKDAYVFMDGNKVLYDMEGHPVWHLPDIDIPVAGNKVRDLKISPFNTITFVVEPMQAYEMNYNGNILWKGPNNGKISGNSTENYHHQLNMLPNGHYMVLGNIDTVVPTPFYTGYDTQVKNVSTPFGTIIEYDRAGKVVWSWRSDKYFYSHDLRYRKKPKADNIYDTHENAFFFDEKEKVIYLSFREISRIIKIRYPQGNVVKIYGQVYRSGTWEVGNPFFCHQHSPILSADKHLYVFNNGCDIATPPRIVKLKEDVHNEWGLKKTWEYLCNTDGVDSGSAHAPWLVSGGNVIELPDSSLFVCMGSQFGKAFIINTDKQVQWNAIPERWDNEKNKWEYIPQYRASIITNRKKMEDLIWNGEITTK